MHIHAGQLNTTQLPHGAHSSTALAARRAEETRKKLFAAAIEPNAAAVPYSPWAISLAGAWGGGNPNGGADVSHSEPTAENDAVQPVFPATAIGVVSYWA